MNLKRAARIILKELEDLGVPRRTTAYNLIYEEAIAASEVMTESELKAYIQNYLDTLPAHLKETEQ